MVLWRTTKKGSLGDSSLFFPLSSSGADEAGALSHSFGGQADSPQLFFLFFVGGKRQNAVVRSTPFFIIVHLSSVVAARSLLGR